MAKPIASASSECTESDQTNPKTNASGDTGTPTATPHPKSVPDRTAARQGIVKEGLTDGASHGAGSRIKAKTMPAYAGTIARKQRHSGTVARLLMIPLGAVVAALVFAPMAYMLWPQGGAIAP